MNVQPPQDSVKLVMAMKRAAAPGKPVRLNAGVVQEWKNKLYLETRLQTTYWIVTKAGNELPSEARPYLVDHTDMDMPADTDPEAVWIVDSGSPKASCQWGPIKCHRPA